MKKRYLFAIAVIAFIAGLAFLARNQSMAVNLKDEVLAKDAIGQNAEVELSALREFTLSHMNASIGFEREAAYQRALEAATPKPMASAEVYAQAQAACPSRADSVTQARCIANYLNAKMPAASAPSAELPQKEDYTVRLSSPNFTTDAAGISFMISAIALVLVLWYASMNKRA